tara:strand:- start:889 stop:1698 length:810 start_codon:yes stop_codon:yes gene_type:complete
MLSTLSTNIKVLIGLSSIIAIFSIYYLIKNIFKSKQIYEKPKSTKSNNSLKENNINELKEISKNIKDLHNTHKNHMGKMSEHIDNVNQHHDLINDIYHNITKNRKRIILDNSNTDYNINSGDITIKNDAIKSELGFPYSIYSIVFVSSTIQKSTSSSTPFVNLILKNSNLQKFLANSNILACIPLNNISGSDTNENVSHYTVAHINHHIIRNPVTEQDLTLQLLRSDGSTNYSLTKHYSITIEMIVDQGIQVSENNYQRPESPNLSIIR